jgi:hypothetical protein
MNMSPWEKRHKFLLDQVEEMKKYKWIVSEQAAKDMGEPALMEWIARFAKEFREAWEKENGPVDEGLAEEENNGEPTGSN